MKYLILSVAIALTGCASPYRDVYGKAPPQSVELACKDVFLKSYIAHGGLNQYMDKYATHFAFRDSKSCYGRRGYS